MRAGLHRIALVSTHTKAGVGGQHLLSQRQVLVGAQHSRCKTTALHLGQLVGGDVAGSADIAGEVQAAAEQEGLAEGAAIAEFREVQLDALDTGQI